MLLGEETPKIDNPLLITIARAFIKAILLLLNVKFSMFYG